MSEDGIKLHREGQLWAQQGELALAKTLFEKSLRLLEASLSPDEPFLAVVLQSLAAVDLYGPEPVPDMALPHLRRALGILVTRMGDDTTDVAEVLHHLAQAHLLNAGLEQAQPLVLRAIDIYERHEGKTSPSLAPLLHTLARIHQQLGRKAEARRALERAIALMKDHSAEVADWLRSLLAMLS